MYIYIYIHFHALRQLFLVFQICLDINELFWISFPYILLSLLIEEQENYIRYVLTKEASPLVLPEDHQNPPKSQLFIRGNTKEELATDTEGVVSLVKEENGLSKSNLLLPSQPAITKSLWRKFLIVLQRMERGSKTTSGSQQMTLQKSALSSSLKTIRIPLVIYKGEHQGGTGH